MTMQPHLNKLRTDKFLFVMDVPTIMKDLQSTYVSNSEHYDLNSLQFSLIDAVVPSVNIPEHALHFGGQNYNVTSYDRPAYAPLTYNFVIDNEFKNYWVLWKWLQLIQDPIDASYAGRGIFPDGAPRQEIEVHTDYQTTMYLYLLDEYDKKRVQFKFTNAFVTTLGDFNLNYQDSSSIQSSFTFVFNQMDMELLSDS